MAQTDWKPLAIGLLAAIGLEAAVKEMGAVTESRGGHAKNGVKGSAPALEYQHGVYPSVCLQCWVFLPEQCLHAIHSLLPFTR